MKGSYILLYFGLMIFLLPGCSDQGNIEKGRILFNDAGCRICHSTSGDKNLYGPPLNSIYNQQVSVTREGQKKSVIIDRKYLIRSMTDPEYEKLSGYESKKMPPVSLSSGEIKLITDYLISLSE